MVEQKSQTEMFMTQPYQIDPPFFFIFKIFRFNMLKI